MHILERQSSPPSCVVCRLNRRAIRVSRAFLDGQIDAQKCGWILTRRVSISQAQRLVKQYTNDEPDIVRFLVTTQRVVKLAVTAQIAPEIGQFKAKNGEFTGVNDHFLTPKWRISGVS